MIQLLLEAFDDAYQIMEKAFPKSELRPYKKMKVLFEEEKILFYGLYTNQKVNAVIVIWEFEDFIFLENFAVCEEARGEGLGTKVLEDIKTTFQKTIVLEVEEAFDTWSEKRIAFYQRNGFVLTPFGYLQPPLNDEINEIPLKIMSYPKELTLEEFTRIKKDIFEKVFEYYEKV